MSFTIRCADMLAHAEDEIGGGALTLAAHQELLEQPFTEPEGAMAGFKVGRYLGYIEGLQRQFREIVLHYLL